MSAWSSDVSRATESDDSVDPVERRKLKQVVVAQDPDRALFQARHKLVQPLPVRGMRLAEAGRVDQRDQGRVHSRFLRLRSR